MFNSADDYLALCRIFNYRFKNQALLAQAITRKTAWMDGKQENSIGHQEALTYLGGDILRAVIDDLLFASNPDYAKGNLSYERDKYIGKHAIAHVAEDLDLDSYILMSGADTGNFKGPGRAKILSDTLKALLAAAFIDTNKNYSFVKTFIAKHWRLAPGYAVIDELETNSGLFDDTYQYLIPGYTFQDSSLLARAMTRKSAVQEGKRDRALGHNETLATLGDGVLRMIVADILLDGNSQNALGTINKKLDELVGNCRLAVIAEQFELDDYLVMGKSDQYNFNREGRNKILAATLEAMIGAIFIDSDRDYQLIKQFICKHWQLKESTQAVLVQERAQPVSCSTKHTFTYKDEATTHTYTTTTFTSSNSNSCPTPKADTANPYYESKNKTSGNASYTNYHSIPYSKKSNGQSNHDGPDWVTALAAIGFLAASGAAAYYLNKNEEAEAEKKNKDKQKDNTNDCVVA